MSAPTRRAVLAGAAAFSAAPITTPTEAEPLLASYREWEQLRAEHASVLDDPTRHVTDEELGGMCYADWKAVDAVFAAPARTLQGAIAKLRIAVAFQLDNKPREEWHFEEEAMFDVLTDLERLAGGAA